LSSGRADSESDGRRTVEVRARTVDEAVARGLVRLGGLSRSEVSIEIVSEGKGGLLGFGAEEAVVRLTTLLPGEEPARTGPSEPVQPVESEPEAEAAESEEVEPGRDEEVETEPVSDSGEESDAEIAHEAVEVEGADEEPGGMEPTDAEAGAEAVVPDREMWPTDEAGLEASVIEYTSQLLELLGCTNITIERQDTLLPVDIEDEESFVLSIRADGAERLLRHDAEPLLALQFLVRLAVTRMSDKWMNLLLDVNGDRARRVKELFHLAEQSAELVEREGRPVSLPPMTPYERRVVHLALRNHETVATQSIGTGDSRKVTVRLKGQMLTGV